MIILTNFNRTKSFTKANIQNVPDDKAVVYKIKNDTGKNLYTGIAGRGRVQDRLLEHKELKKEFIPGGTKFQFTQVENKDRAKKIETQIIKKEQPKFNEQNK
ncbi:GIY-YIG nuclease family protein [Patescibacteria group bacterium]|nr:GIY-YIG nuclease family protein [Patescibacteria group bacterium]